VCDLEERWGGGDGQHCINLLSHVAVSKLWLYVALDYVSVVNSGLTRTLPHTDRFCVLSSYLCLLSSDAFVEDGL